MKVLTDLEFQNLSNEEKNRYYSAIRLDYEIVKKRLIDTETNIERIRGLVDNLNKIESDFVSSMNDVTNTIVQDLANVKNVVSYTPKQIIEFEGYSYDMMDNVLFYNGDEIRLTKNESLIFNLLVLNNGTIVPTKTFPIRNVRGFIYNLKTKANFINIGVVRNKGYILQDSRKR